ncbi:MAG TPA: hypothetical protein VGA08_02390 [Candidatus Saccharimonadales bacterium]
MSKNDKTISGILGFGIGVMYPILVYFMVNTFVPRAETPRLRSSLAAHGNDDFRQIVRLGLALFISFLAIGLAIAYFRQVTEVFRGILGGAAVTIFFAAILLSIISGTDSENLLSVMLLLFSFLGLTALVHWADQSILP